MLSFFVYVQAAVLHLRRRDERGQTTAEYALVLLGAAAVALVLAVWAAKSGKVTGLLDAVVDKIVSKL
jgi:Flp pilus assembly pilin Flp